MTRPIPVRSLLEAPAATFEQPFEMLEACHQRVHRMLDLLARLRTHLGTHGADTQAQQAARDVMRYFDQAAPLHHQDEELHVFPPLLAQGDAGVVAVVRRLQADHVAMERNWAAARAVLVRVGEGRVQRLAPEDDAALDAFAGVYGDHIQAEEEIAYPAAQAVLDPATVAQAGTEMARRRGIK